MDRRVQLPPGQIVAQWVIDSETSREYLIDLDKQRIIAERVNGKLVDPCPPQPPLDVPNEGC